MTDYYASATGSSGNPGTEGSPWTLSYGLGQIVAGDTLYLLDTGGNYSFSGKTLTAPGVAGNLIALRNAPGHTPVISGASGSLYFEAGYWLVDGITFTGFTSQMIGLGRATALNEASNIDATNVTIQNCIFSNGDRTPINAKRASNLSVLSCTFSNCQASNTSYEINMVSLRYYCPNALVSGCLFTNCGADGVHVLAQGYLSGASAANFIIEDSSFIINNGYPAASTYEDGIDVKYANGGTIRRCYFEGYRPVNYGASSADGAALIIHDNARNIRVLANDFYDNTIGIIVAVGTGGTNGTGSGITLWNNKIRECRAVAGQGGWPIGIYTHGDISILHNACADNDVPIRWLNAASGSYTPAMSYVRNTLWVDSGLTDDIDPVVVSRITRSNNAFDNTVVGDLDGTGNVIADALVDADLVPQAGSPLIGAGYANSGVLLDKNGVSRNVDAPTIGAYEYLDSPTAPVYEDDSRLTGYWKFANNATDTGANGNDLSGVNSPTFNADGGAVGGYQAVLVRSSNQYFEIADGSQTGLDLVNAFTVVGRLTRTTSTGAGDMYIVSKLSGDDGYQLRIAGGFGAIYLEINDPDGGDGYYAGGLYSFPLDTEVFFAAIFTGTALAIYLDGAQVGLGLETEFASTAVRTNAAAFQVGARGGANSLDATVNYVATFDAVLTPAEIEGIRQNGILVVPTPPSDATPPMDILGQTAGVKGLF